MIDCRKAIHGKNESASLKACHGKWAFNIHLLAGGQTTNDMSVRCPFANSIAVMTTVV